MTADTHDPRFDNWPVHGDEDAEFVGVASGFPSGGVGQPVYYDEKSRRFFGAEADPENEQFRRLPDHDWNVDPEETVGEAIKRLGEELGWDSLSEFAESHLEDDGS